MLFSYNWLKELSGTEKSPEELAELLLARAFEVEGVKKYEHGLDGVVVGEVLKAEPHPNAERLKVTEVRVSGSAIRSFLHIGDGKPLGIVCGAPNVAVGQKVAVALPGAKLPNGMEMKETEIRGVKSAGMICAQDELGLGTDHEGIWVLPDDTEVGEPLAEAMGLDDTLLDVKILPNRGTDALSHYGLAREIAALEGREFPFEGMFAKNIPERAGDGEWSVAIDTAKACVAYAGLSFRLTNGVSGLPLPMLGRMMMLGHHVIHGAADVANHLSLLYGQPMHAFDADKLSGKKITVRFAKAGEKLILLDDREIVLSGGDLVIADAKGPVALAGIMGGKDSAVSAETKEVFFEIANFDPATIRRSRVRHGLSTDAAYLFEHGADPSWPSKLRGEVIAHFTDLFGAEYQGGVSVFAAGTSKEKEIVFPFARIEGLLGVVVPQEKALSILRSLSIGAEIRGRKLHATVPSFRPDLKNEADIVEEIGRVYGYEHIVPSAPRLPVVSREKNTDASLERGLKEYLACAGFDEIMTYSFYGRDLLGQSGVPEDVHLTLENPMNPDQTYLRAKLLPSVLDKAIENMPRVDGFRIFEFGRVYSHEGGSVREEKRIASALSLKETNSGEAFLAQKGEIERLFGFFHTDETISFRPAADVSPLFHPGRTAHIMAGEEVIGVVGEAHPSFVRKSGSRKIAIAELSFPALLRLYGSPITLKPIPRFPSVSRDISLVVPKNVAVGDLARVIRESGAPLLRDAGFFDVYEKGAEKNVAFHLSFGADDRTIEGEAAEAALEGIVRAAEKAFGAKSLSQ